MVGGHIHSPSSASQAFLYSCVWLFNATLKEEPMIDASLPPFSRMDASIMENLLFTSLHFTSLLTIPTLLCVALEMEVETDSCWCRITRSASDAFPI